MNKPSHFYYNFITIPSQIAVRIILVSKTAGTTCCRIYQAVHKDNRKGILVMYKEDFDENKQETSEGSGKTAEQGQSFLEENSDTTIRPTGENVSENNNTSAGGQYGEENLYGRQQGSGAYYGSSQTVGGNYYGSGGQSAGNSYGNGSQSAGNSYGNGGQSVGNSYGNGSQSAGNFYGNNSQPAGNHYGNSSQPSANPYGNGSYGNGNPYGNVGANQGNTYGNSQYGAGNQYGYGSRSQLPHQHYAPWQQPETESGKAGKRHKKAKGVHPLIKKAAGITAAALLFGVVAGGTISGISLITDQFSARNAVEETHPSISQAETVPASPAPASGQTSAVPTMTNDVSAIVEQAMPSVVAINSITEYQVQGWFGQSQTYEGRGSGSGIIVGESDSELLIVTNNHVIEGARDLSVAFLDNENVVAHVKGTDSENDLAVIAVPLDQIPDDTRSKIALAVLGDSDSLKVGQGVIAIGNALGYGQSVTVGYVSALDREVQTEQQTTRNLLQTDAAINPGNSGGALLNMQGEVIGINSAKYSSTEVEGMGYAIPISKVHDIIDNLMTKKTRVQVEQEKQGYLGIQGQDIDTNASSLYGMPQGVYVYKIMEGGAAASSSLKEKDIITKFDGQSVRSMTELKTMLTYYAGGDVIELTVQSLVDGQYVERQVEIVLGTRADERNN